MPSSLRKELLRDCARSIGKEPSEFFNTLYTGSRESLWLLSKDLDVVWHSDNAGEVIGLGGEYIGSPFVVHIPQIKEVIGAMKGSPIEVKGTVQGINNKEYEVVCYPLSTEGQITGYIVTLSEGFKVRLTQFLDKQKVREDNLCQIVSSLPQL